MPGVDNGKGPPPLRHDGAAYRATRDESDSLAILPLDILPLKTPELTSGGGRESGPIAIGGFLAIPGGFQGQSKARYSTATSAISGSSGSRSSGMVRA